MSSPDPSSTIHNGSLDINGHGEKLVVASESPDEMSGDEHGHSHNNGRLANDASDVSEDEGGVDEDEGEKSDEDSEEDDDEEPALKYERIGGELPDLLKKDSASALAISNNLLVNMSGIAEWTLSYNFYRIFRS
jgi:hypothetical protein